MVVFVIATPKGLNKNLQDTSVLLYNILFYVIFV